MASNFFSVNGVDFDDLFELTPDSSHSAREWLKDDTSGLFANGATVYGDVKSGSQSLWDRYLGSNYGDTITGDTAGVWCKVQGRNAQGQPDGNFETIKLQNYLAKKGEGGVPVISPSSGTYSTSKTINGTGQFTEVEFTFSKNSNASNFSNTGSTVTFSEVDDSMSNNTFSSFVSGYPTVSNNGVVTCRLSVFNDSGSSPDSCVVTVKYKLSNAYGDSNEYTMTINVTYNWSGGGGGGGGFPE